MSTFFEKVIKRKTIIQITGLAQYSERVIMWFSDGSRLEMHHEKDCCEIVRLEEFDLTGKLYGLVVDAYQEVSRFDDDDDDDGSKTWTFYRIRVESGEELTMRWLGESSGYYSEDVDLTFVHADGREVHMEHA